MGRGKASDRKKGRPKSADPERQLRRDAKNFKKHKAGLDRAMRKIQEMSGIVGLDGKTPIRSEQEAKARAKESELHYKAGGLHFGSDMTPEAMLQGALEKAQQSVGNKAYNESRSSGNNDQSAQMAGTMAASAVTDPFMMEPAAAAVFMYLSRELEYRDGIIAQLSERLVALGAEPLDTIHPYPVAPKVEDGTADS